MPALDIFYFDDVQSEREDNEPSWTAIVEQLGFRPDYRFNAALQGLADILPQRPHLIILDNVIDRIGISGQPESLKNEGARFIEEHKGDHPDSVFILYTDKTFHVDQLGARIPNPDMIVSKAYLAEKRYQDYIAAQLKARLNRAPIEALDIDVGEEGDAWRAGTKSLVEQVIIDWVPKTERAGAVTARLKKLSGGYSKATVYRLELSGGPTGASVPTILKLGKCEEIEREIAAFQRYAKWLLPHDMRVDIVGKGTIGSRSALCYAFALGGQENVEPAADALKAGRAKVIETVIRHLFSSQRQAWYGKSDESGPHLKNYVSNLGEYPGDKDDWRNRSLETTLRRIATADGIVHERHDAHNKIGRHGFDDVRPSLRRLPDVKVAKCICHGDLNANNIFFHGGNLALIDFEQTGPNHVFRDFVSFESSVRSLYAPSTSGHTPFEELVDLELALLREPDMIVLQDPVLLQVQRIRAAAFKRFPYAEPVLYTATILLHLWKLIGFRNDTSANSIWGDRGERYLAAGLTAALMSLPKR